MSKQELHKLALAALLAALSIGCEGNKADVVGPGVVAITRSTSTTTSTTTSTIPPSTTAAFIFSPLTPAALEVVSFNAFGSTPAPGRTIVSYVWDFGDGQSKTGVSVTHDFFPQGLYIVTLTVTDSAGEQAKVSKPIGAGVPLPSTTTTSIPTNTAVRYVNATAAPDIPADLSLFFQLLAGQSVLPPVGASATALRGLGDFKFEPLADSRYTVQGFYSKRNGDTGTISGVLVGTLTPAPSGTFTGTLTANVNGCIAKRDFSGAISSSSLQWTGAVPWASPCQPDPFAYSSINLLKSDVPPPVPPTTTSSTTTSSTTTSTTTTTSVAPPLISGAIGSSPSGTGLASATVYSFQFTTPPSGGVPPYSYSWAFGDASPAGSGTAPTHIFITTGTFAVTATVTDSRGSSAQASTSVAIGNVTGGWTVSYTVPALSSAPFTVVDTLVLNQDQTQVTGTVETPNCPLTSAAGSVSNPRSLSMNTTYCFDGPSIPVSYQGTLDTTLGSWTGTVVGPSGCPSTGCNFTGKRTTF